MKSLRIFARAPFCEYSVIGYIAFVSFALQQAFNATAVVRHMRRLQLGTSNEGPNPTLPSPCRTHMLMPEEDAGAFCGSVSSVA